MTYVPKGEHLIAGDWIAAEPQFSSTPASGLAHKFSCGSVAHVNRAAEAAEAAFLSYSQLSRKTRAAFLHCIADEIEARGAEITEIGTQETGLPEARLQGERGRTTGQIRLFAEHILKDDFLDHRHDEALPDRAPLPRPDLHLIQRPLGPVAVFGASNFPLAFSTAGGDTAAALAAGCPVVVKGHEAHPGTAAIIAEAIQAAIQSCDIHPGVFSLIQGGDHAVGAALVQHPLIQAVGFTGSLRGGRALFDLCAARPTPIPFFGELGSINPMFLFENALNARGTEIAQGWAGSLTMGAGQFCTNPGVAVLLAGEQAESFAQVARDALAEAPSQTMLTDGIATAYCSGKARLEATEGVTTLLSTDSGPRSALPNLYTTSAKTWLENASLGEEVFGPLGVIVTADSLEEMQEIARNLEGQLTCTLHVDAEDMAPAASFMPILERKAGRVLANGFPTGVEVSDTMVHGGPYPASTNFGATSVGTLAIRRFVRPVCYQNLPADLLPDDIKS